MKNNYILHLHISYILYNFVLQLRIDAETSAEGQGVGEAKNLDCKRELLPDVVGSKTKTQNKTLQNYGNTKNCDGDQSPSKQERQEFYLW